MAEAMDQVARIFEKLANHDFRIGENYWVDIVHINHPHSFFVRPVVFREDLDYLQEAGDQLEAGEVQEGRTIIYKSETLELQVRGDILKVVNENGDIKCNIKAIDYGCEDETVPIWRLCNLKNDVAVPPLASQCLLADCKSFEPDSWLDETIESLKCYVGNERARMSVRGRTLNKLVVELINSCPNDIATMLNLTGYTVLGNSAEMPGGSYDNPPYEGRYFECRAVEIGDVLRVRCQTGSDFQDFYVAEVFDFKQYLKHRHDFTDYCMYQRNPRPHDMGVGKGVGYKTQLMRQYERTIVKEIICPTKVVVQQIDWGIIHEANLNHLKVVKPIIFGQMTAVALYCRVSPDQQAELEPSVYLCSGAEYLITILEVGDNFATPHIVEISDLSTK